MKTGKIGIPSEAECERLIEGMGMLENIVAHCRQVCRVSLLIADNLKPSPDKRDKCVNEIIFCQKNAKNNFLLTNPDRRDNSLLTKGLNRELILAAALLHDITKTRSLQTNENHAETGAQLLSEIGYPEVGRIIGQHVRLDSYFASTVPSEAEVVNYSDKRVLHDRIVPLGERMEYIITKYGREPERKRAILSLWEKTEALEARLFAGLPFAPGDIGHLLTESPL